VQAKELDLKPMPGSPTSSFLLSHFNFGFGSYFAKLNKLLWLTESRSIRHLEDTARPQAVLLCQIKASSMFLNIAKTKT
jgi:hypothetical protein